MKTNNYLSANLIENNSFKNLFCAPYSQVKRNWNNAFRPIYPMILIDNSKTVRSQFNPTFRSRFKHFCAAVCLAIPLLNSITVLFLKCFTRKEVTLKDKRDIIEIAILEYFRDFKMDADTSPNIDKIRERVNDRILGWNPLLVHFEEVWAKPTSQSLYYQAFLNYLEEAKQKQNESNFDIYHFLWSKFSSQFPIEKLFPNHNCDSFKDALKDYYLKSILNDLLNLYEKYFESERDQKSFADFASEHLLKTDLPFSDIKETISNKTKSISIIFFENFVLKIINEFEGNKHPNASLIGTIIQKTDEKFKSHNEIFEWVKQFYTKYIKMITSNYLNDILELPQPDKSGLLIHMIKNKIGDYDFAELKYQRAIVKSTIETCFSRREESKKSPLAIVTYTATVFREFSEMSKQIDSIIKQILEIFEEPVCKDLISQFKGTENIKEEYILHAKNIYLKKIISRHIVAYLEQCKLDSKGGSTNIDLPKLEPLNLTKLTSEICRKFSQNEIASQMVEGRQHNQNIREVFFKEFLINYAELILNKQNDLEDLITNGDKSKHWEDFFAKSVAFMKHFKLSSDKWQNSHYQSFLLDQLSFYA